MGDELQTALPEVPQAGDGQGQASDGRAEEAPKMVPATDLDALRSVKDRELAEARRVAAENERRAREAAQQAQIARQQAETLKKLVEAADPAAAKQIDDQLIAQAKLTQLEQENAYYRQIAETQRYESEVAEWATGLGLDPNSDEVKKAKLEALSTGSQTPFILLQAKAELRREMQQTAPPPAQEVPSGTNSASSAQALVEQQRRIAPATPPSGGSVPNGNTDALYAELGELYKEPTKHAARIEAIRKQIKQIGG